MKKMDGGYLLAQCLKQEGNTLEVMAAVSSWARCVYQTRRIPEYVSRAFGMPAQLPLDRSTWKSLWMSLDPEVRRLSMRPSTRKS
jgi:hypothetical protein